MRVWSLIATIVLGSFTGSIVAQEAQQQAAGGQAAAVRPPVAVIDVGFLLKNHPKMKAEIESIEARMAAADKAMSDKRDAILKFIESFV